MDMRTAINLLEAGFQSLRLPPVMTREPLANRGDPADKFIAAANAAVAATHADLPIDLQKAGPELVRVNDMAQGMRSKRHWEVLRTLKQLADKTGVRMSIQAGSIQNR